MPLVSIIIPNYNHASFLQQRIESVLGQTFRDFEVLLLDDASTDNSAAVLKSYESHEKVTQVFVNASNSGSPFGLWKQGLEMAKGSLVWIAESDDWVEPNFLERLVPKMEDPNVVVGHCKSYNATGEKEYFNPWWDSFGTGFWKEDYCKEGTELLQFYGKYRCPVMNVSSALVRKESIDLAWFPIRYRYCGDWWFWMMLFLKGKVAFCAEPMNYIRVHKQSAIRSQKKSSLPRLRENVEVIKDIHIGLQENLAYSEQYDWLIDHWVEEMFREGKYFNPSYHKTRLPKTFRSPFYKAYRKQLKIKLAKK
ncbi:glycosyltransferase family 2 protein [Aureisphaera galaxeae]|uniref:glycosyltransferase family 2 protein n=1 Tax=Aureisphaera galaxeae TaxID=1538023 RepID=UPI0023502FDF|nr:glycosyltransferase family 2 protein [Aureisphaera galaxeae]MDC8006286.1 glycosyltransferase family 2 protein [Aureisphaera galaxeae]